MVIILPLGGSAEDREQSRAGFIDGVMNSSGARLVQDDLPGETTLLKRPDGLYVAYGERGCSSFGVFARLPVIETRVTELSGAAK